MYLNMYSILSLVTGIGINLYCIVQKGEGADRRMASWFEIFFYEVYK